MDIFKYIEKHKKRRKKFFESDEFTFFLENRPLLNKMPRFSYLHQNKLTEFEVMRMNILFHAYLNKVMIEEEVANLEKYGGHKKGSNDSFMMALKERLVDQPYFMEKKAKIYIPFFSKAINAIYLNDPFKLTKYPYSALKDDFSDTMIDPFDLYGYELYNSYFTRLIKISEADKCAAFFHYDTNTIYIINEQGRLDASIVLFDRFILKPNYNHMLERIKPVIDAYFSCDRKLFLNEMREKGFMSSQLYYLIKVFDWRRNK